MSLENDISSPEQSGMKHQLQTYLCILGSWNASYGNILVRYMQCKWLLGVSPEVGNMVKTNLIQFGFWSFANLGLLGLLPFNAPFATQSQNDKVKHFQHKLFNTRNKTSHNLFHWMINIM